MQINANSPWVRYGRSLLLVAGAGLIRWALEPLVGTDMPLWLFVPAVMLAAWYGGSGPGLLALGVSVLVADYFFMLPRYSLFKYQPVDEMRLLIFALMGALITWLSQQRQHGLQDLRDSEERFASAFAASPLALTITSLTTGRLLEVNETFVTLTGYSRAEALGRTPDELGLWLDPQERVEKLAEIRQHGRVRNTEHRFRMRDGTTIVALLSAELLTLNGEPCVLTVIDEITERKEAEARLQAAELRYRNFIAQSSEGIWRCELSEPIPINLSVEEQIELIYQRAWLAECNDAMARQYGFSSATELIGQRLEALLVRTDPANEEYLRAFIEAHYRLTDGESRELGAGGEELYFLNNLVGQVENGLLIRAWGTQRDITEQRLAAHALRASEHRYRTLISQVREYAIFSLDPAGIINTWNEGCYKILGYKREEFIGLDFVHLFTPTDMEAGIPAMELQQAHREGAASNDRWMQRKTGERFWASGITTALHNSKGELTGFTKVMRDLTERQLMEEALRDSEAQFRQLADAMPQIVWAAQADGSIDYYNRRGAEDMQLRPGEQGVQSWSHVLHPDDVAACAKAWSNSINTGQPFECEYRFREPATGVYRWHLGRALPIHNFAGYIVRWFGTSTDIDDLKRANEERMRLLSREQALRVQAEQANRLKDEFLTTISHELRTPLHHILGNIGLLRSGNLQNLEALRALNTIERNARTQQQIVEDLLDTSHLVTTSLKLELKPVDLGALLAQAVETARALAQVKGIEFRTPNGWPRALIQGDEQRLQQALGHLLANALKFTPPGGRVALTLDAQSAAYMITIRDTGLGIEPEFLPHVFERFSQQDSSSTRRFGGLGLGLALVKHIVELHGGTVAAASTGANQGSTFTLTLPVQPPVVAAEAVVSHPAPTAPAGLPAAPDPPKLAVTPVSEAALLAYKPDLQGLRLLIVEGDADTRTQLRRVLQACQAEVIALASAQEAFSYLDTAPPGRLPQLLVCDLNLPDEDGFQLLQRIRQLPSERGGQLPAVALTEVTSAKERLRTLAAGFQMHVPKPIEPTELAVVIASLRERKP